VFEVIILCWVGTSIVKSYIGMHCSISLPNMLGEWSRNQSLEWMSLVWKQWWRRAHTILSTNGKQLSSMTKHGYCFTKEKENKVVEKEEKYPSFTLSNCPLSYINGMSAEFDNGSHQTCCTFYNGDATHQPHPPPIALRTIHFRK